MATLSELKSIRTSPVAMPFLIRRIVYIHYSDLMFYRSHDHPRLLHIRVVEPQDVLVRRRADDLDPLAGDLADASSGAAHGGHEIAPEA